MRLEFVKTLGEVVGHDSGRREIVFPGFFAQLFDLGDAAAKRLNVLLPVVVVLLGVDLAEH